MVEAQRGEPRDVFGAHLTTHGAIGITGTLDVGPVLGSVSPAAK